jgi:hypothetical protein
MSLLDKNIIITPNKGASTEPTIRFTGADASSSANITLRVINSGTVGTLSFEGTSGQLFSMTDSMSGTIFSVNDISGIPSIEVFDTGEVRLAQYNGFVHIPNTTNASSTTTGALQVDGGVGIGGNLYVGGTLNAASVTGTITNTTNVGITNDVASTGAQYLTFVSASTGNLPIKVAATTGLVYIPSTGHLGIGIAAPAASVHIASASIGPLDQLIVESTTGNSALAIKGFNTTSYAYITHYQGTVGKFEVGTNPTADYYINPTVQAGSTGAAIFVQRTTGNVGIGNVSPAVKLDVGGSINLSTGNNVTWGGAYATNIPTIYATSGASSYIALAPAGSTAALNQLFINNAGNVGLGGGTTVPRSRFEVTSGTQNTNADVPGTTAAFVGPQSTGQGSTVSIESNDAQAADTGGVLGFGGRYITGGTGYANWAAIKGLKIDGGSGNYGGYLSFYTRPNGASNIERMRITGNGGIAFGGATNYGTSGFILKSNGDAAPTWVNPTTIGSGTATGANYARALQQTDGTTFLVPTNPIGASGSRAADIAPNAYNHGLFSEFKNASLYGTAGTYSGLITYANWVGTAASTGDSSYQLLFSPTSAGNSILPPRLQLRSGIDTAWGKWSDILHSGNHVATTGGWTPVISGGVRGLANGSFKKDSGTNAGWDGQVYSAEGFSTRVFCGFRPADATSLIMAGLNSDPAADTSYLSIDYAWYLNGGNIAIYEGGASIYASGTYTVNDYFSITYDGITIRYYYNDTLIRSVARAISGSLSFDSSYYTLGASLNNVSFGSLTHSDLNPLANRKLNTLGVNNDAPTNGPKVFISNGANGWPAASGTTQTAGALRLRGGDNAVLDFGMNSTNTWIQATDQSALNNIYNLHLNPNGGNIGIGLVGAPAGKLHIIKASTYNSESEGGINIASGVAATNAKLILGTAGDSFGYIQSMQQATNWTTRPLVLQPNAGTVGIGVLIPAATLHVNGNLKGNGLYENSLARGVMPVGATYVTSAAAPVGAFKIKLPDGSRLLYPMLSFTVEMYSYSTGTSRTLRVGGHFSGASWHNIFAYCLTDYATNLDVRFGYDAANAMCVWIGEIGTTWSYPQVFVTDFQNGYSAALDSWYSGWTITLVTAFDTVTNGPYTPAMGLNSKNFGTYVSGVVSGSTSQIVTNPQATSGTYYPVFVGSNGAAATQYPYTGGTITFNPVGGLLQLSGESALNTTTPGLGNYGLHFTGQTTADYARGITWNGGTGTTGAQAGIYVQGSGAYGSKMYFATTNSYATGSITRIAIDQNGNVGIGTTAPTGLLSVKTVSSAAASTAAWSNAHSVFGPNVASATGAALGLGYNTISDASEIISLAPSVDWKPLSLFSAGLNVYSSNGTLALTVTSSGGVAFGTSATAYGTVGQVLKSNGNAAPLWVDQSTISVGNATTLNSKASSAFHQRIHYSTTAGNTGYYKISILPATSWMMSFTIRIYQNYVSHDIRISGYNYGGNFWYAPAASLIDSDATSIAVQFGYDSAYNLWVAVPANAYTGLDILDVVNGYTQFDGNYADQFAITNQTTLTGTVQTTITAYRPAKYNEVLRTDNYNSYSPTLTGGSASGTWGISITGNAATATYAAEVNAAFGRTDVAAYPVCWIANNTNKSQAYSCAAVTITSSSGQLSASILYSSGNVIAYSDERVKTNWRGFDYDFVDQLAQVKSGIYDRIDAKLTQVGVSAQSLRSVMPNAVVEDDEGKLSVAYGHAALVSAVELAKEVVSLNARIARLEALVSKLIEG